MKHRLFTAIDISESVRRQAVDVQKRLEGLHLPVSWEQPEKFHLTMNFLGRVDEDKIPKLLDNLNLVCRSYSPFSLKPAFLETLYHKHEPSIIYLSLKGDLEILKEFQKNLVLNLADVEIPQSYRFMPHLTLARLERTDPVATKSFLDKVTGITLPRFSAFPVHHLSVYESFISKAGTHYQLVRQLVIK